MKVAAVDIGTNTVRLLLATAVGQDNAIRLESIERHEVITKLGEGLDAAGRLGDRPMQRALDGLSHYADLIAAAGAEVWGGVATAATRSAANGSEFRERVTDALGFQPRVIDGVEEARLTFLGATTGLGSAEPYCVIDVGGGSTEFVIGCDYPEYAVSIDIGSVRLTERVAALRLADTAAIRNYVDSLFGDVIAPLAPATVLGSGGTFVTLAAVAGGIPTKAVDVGGAVVITLEEVVATVERLAGMTVDEIAMLPSVVPARAAVLQAGAICAERAVAHIGAAAVEISVRDILDGLAIELVTQQWPGAELPGH